MCTNKIALKIIFRVVLTVIFKALEKLVLLTIIIKQSYSQKCSKKYSVVCWKTPIFQSKQPMTKEHHISLNSQCTAVLNGIICFSARFCDKYLLVLKMRLFFRKQKGARVSQWQKDVNAVVISALSSTKACLSFLKF